MKLGFELLAVHTKTFDLVNETIDVLSRDFQPRDDATNEETERDATIFKEAITLAVYQQLSTTVNKVVGNCKENLDRHIPNDVVGGSTELLFNQSGIAFSKKRNNNTTQLSAKDLTVALMKLGVDAKTLEKATELATKVKKGNTYYIVEDA